MNKTLSRTFVLLFFALPTFVIGVFNAFLPIGIHVALAPITGPAPPSNNDLGQLYNSLVFRPLSRAIIVLHPDKCGMRYLDAGQVVADTNGRLSFLIEQYGNANANRELLRSIFERTLKYCSPEGNPSEPSPLLTAVILRRVEPVQVLVERGADKSRKFVRPGSRIDGMDAFSLSRYLSERADDPSAREEWDQISAILLSSRSQ